MGLSGLICSGAYWLGADRIKLPWEKFSTARLEELRNEGKTILVDFTADWCFTCKVNEATALDTSTTLKFVKKHKIVSLQADFTEQDPEIQHWLDLFGRKGVPLTVIFAPGRDKAIEIPEGVFTQATLLEKLQEAVKDVPKTTAAPKHNQKIRMTSGVQQRHLEDDQLFDSAQREPKVRDDAGQK